MSADADTSRRRGVHFLTDARTDVPKLYLSDLERIMPRAAWFSCPHCKALYQVVRVELGPETDDRRITCCACGGPLVARVGITFQSISICAMAAIAVDAPVADYSSWRTVAGRHGGGVRRYFAAVAKIAAERIRAAIAATTVSPTPIFDFRLQGTCRAD